MLTRIQVLLATTSTLTLVVDLPEVCARACFFPSPSVVTCDRSLNVLPIAITGGGDDNTSFHTAIR